MADHENFQPADWVRHLMRGRDRAVLSTIARDDGTDEAGGPYGSLVLTACAPDAAPLLLISDLAEHTMNLTADPRVSLLFDGTAGLEDPLTGARATVLGRAEKCDGDEAALGRYLRRQPSAEMYAGFADFHLFRVEVSRAHIVAGFGRIDWVDAGEILDPTPLALVERETDIVSHMNEDHADAIQLYATKLLGRPAGDWRMTGCDVEGCDLRAGGEVARLAFENRAGNAEQARAELVRAVKRARGES